MPGADDNATGLSTIPTAQPDFDPPVFARDLQALGFPSLESRSELITADGRLECKYSNFIVAMRFGSWFPTLRRDDGEPKAKSIARQKILQSIRAPRVSAIDPRLRVLASCRAPEPRVRGDAA
jgi:hypothetical protein